jgi:hypothetical protein
MTKTIFIAAYVLIFIAIAIFIVCPDATAAVYSSISGRVIAEDTGQGLSGVSVEASLLVGEQGGRYYGTTNDKGVYALNDLAPGTYLVGFSKQGSLYVSESPHVEVVLPKGKHLVNVNYILQLGGAISGAVYGADGMTPLSDVGLYANVQNLQQEWVKSSQYGGTDADGKFLLQGLPQSDNCSLEVIAHGHAHVIKTVKITKGTITGNTNFTVKWNDITGINGYVRSSIDGKLITNARVELADLSGNEIGYTRTDESGKYSIVGVTPGIYEATAYWPEGDDWIDKTNILVESGKSTLTNFDFDKAAPVTENTPIIWDRFLGLFISNAFGAGPGKQPTYPDPKFDPNNGICSGPQIKKIKATYEKVRERIKVNSPRCMTDFPGGTRSQLLNKLKEKLIIKCQRQAFADCWHRNERGVRVNDCARGAVSGNDMSICPLAFSQNSCGCLEGTVFHELVHNIGVENEDKPEECAKACFKCARLRCDDIHLCN